MLPFGKADWLWDEELQTQIPCCSRLVQQTHRWKTCGNRLTPDQIEDGDCGQHTKDPDAVPY